MFSLSSAISACLVPLLIASPVWSQAIPAAASASNPTASNQLRLRLADSDGSQILANTRTARGLGIQVVDENGAPVSDAAVAFRFPDVGSSASFADGSHSAVAYTDAGGNAHVGNFQWNAVPGPVALRVTATKGASHAGLMVEQTLISGTPSQASVPVRPIPTPAAGEAEAAIRTPEPEEVVVASAAAASEVAPRLASAGGDYMANPYRGARLGVSPIVSISSSDKNGHDYSYHSSKKKWVILAIIAGAGAGAAFALMNSKSASTAVTSSSGVSVGSPTISIGHP